jgi:hypothetical protein
MYTLEVSMLHWNSLGLVYSLSGERRHFFTGEHIIIPQAFGSEPRLDGCPALSSPAYAVP